MDKKKNSGMILSFVLIIVTAACIAPSAFADALLGGTLDPTTITKYSDPLVIPPVMEPTAIKNKHTKYKIGVRQFGQQVLPTGMPKTTVWGYGNSTDNWSDSGINSSFNFPAFTIEARKDEVVRVDWVNQLLQPVGTDTTQFLPHLFPVDQTLHWANPPGPPDTMGTDPTFYTGPVPIVTHVHGAHVPDISDGFPEAWYLPNADNIPFGYYTQGSFYGSVTPAPPGTAVFEYPNDQRASTLWYHDHTLGMTRLNVYAGMAGFWIIRDDEEDSLNLPGPAPKLNDPPGTKYYEIPIVIQDRSFNEDGSLFYPDSREFFDGFTGPYIPDYDNGTPSDVHPIWNPEFFGNTMVVNGRTWPYLEVEPRLYRFRFLNGCNSRFLILKFAEEGAPSFHQIGSEGGLLPGAPIELDQLLMAPAERADVIVDFSELYPGDELILLNTGPDEPFKGLYVGDPADPGTTGQVMKFKVVEATGQGNAGVIPVTLPDIDPLETVLPERNLTLNESVSVLDDVPIAALLGIDTNGGGSLPLKWSDDITEDPTVGDTEIWNIINLTEDAHPIHLHLVMFQVVSRQPFDVEEYESFGDIVFTDDPRGPEDWETGWKDTVIAYPGEVTKIIAHFDLAGLYVWHCHILEHEDNEMMRPYIVLPPAE